MTPLVRLLERGGLLRTSSCRMGASVHATLHAKKMSVTTSGSCAAAGNAQRDVRGRLPYFPAQALARAGSRPHKPPMALRVFFTLPVTVFSLAIMAGCNNNPVENKSIAQVGQAVASAAAPAPTGTVYSFSEVGSRVSFVGAKITGKHDGSFGKFRGQVNLVDGDIAKSSVRVDVETASLSADQEKLSGHLKSADFFDVEKFPNASFQSTEVHVGGQAGATHTVIGNLELHGVSKSIRFPATIAVTSEGVTVKSEFGINRKDFGIVYPGKPDDLIKDEVLVVLDVVAKK